MAGALDGIRVIDVSAMVSGLVAGVPVVTRDELVAHPQILANELLVESRHPHAGRLRQPRPAARFEATPTEIRRPAPLRGEHTDEVLRELGCSAPEIAELRASRIVA